MGNSVAADVILSNSDRRTELDLSQPLNHLELCKHKEGQCSSSSLQAIPYQVLDSTWMYKKLLISCNCLTSLPPELPLRLPHLTFLDLNYNHISTLPNNFSLFIHLRTLLLSHNNLEQLPPSFVCLKLEKLDVSYNRLKELPANIGYMPKLTKLNVSFNNLTSLPLSLGHSPRLTVILAQGNTCQVPPQELCDNGTSDDIIAYLNKYRESNDEGGDIRSPAHSLQNVFPRVRLNDATSLLLNPHSPKMKYVQAQTQTTHTASRVKTPLVLPNGSSMNSLSELGDKITGLIYGAVIGDALGVGTEFMTLDECKFHYDSRNFSYENIIKDEHTSHWKRGEWTSNSDQMFLVLDSVLHWAGMVDELDFAQRLIQWKNNGFSDLNESEEYLLSETINEVLKIKTYQYDPHGAAKNLLTTSQQNGGSSENGLHKSTNQFQNPLYCDNGALPRALILGVVHFHNLKEVISNSVRICLSTHADKRCVAACVALSVIVAMLLQQKQKICKSEMEELLKAAYNAAVDQIGNEEHGNEFRTYMSSENYESIGLCEKGNVHYVFKTLGAATIAIKSQQDFKTALADVILQGGHGSMNGCIAGGLLGCIHGFSNLPRPWVEGLLQNHKKWLNIKINRLLDKMGLP